MSLTSYAFHFREDGSIKRLPMARWNRICNNDERFIGFENQRIRIAYAYLELQQRKPLYCYRIEGSKYRIDHNGMLDHCDALPNLVSPLDALMENNDKQENTAIDAKTLFKMRRYKIHNSWKPTTKDIDRVIGLIWHR